LSSAWLQSTKKENLMKAELSMLIQSDEPMYQVQGLCQTMQSPDLLLLACVPSTPSYAKKRQPHISVIMQCIINMYVLFIGR
jgi:hypothetical protein